MTWHACKYAAWTQRRVARWCAHWRACTLTRTSASSPSFPALTHVSVSVVQWLMCVCIIAECIGCEGNMTPCLGVTGGSSVVMAASQTHALLWAENPQQTLLREHWLSALHPCKKLENQISGLQSICQGSPYTIISQPWISTVTDASPISDDTNVPCLFCSVCAECKNSCIKWWYSENDSQQR